MSPGTEDNRDEKADQGKKEIRFKPEEVDNIVRIQPDKSGLVRVKPGETTITTSKPQKSGSKGTVQKVPIPEFKPRPVSPSEPPVQGAGSTEPQGPVLKTHDKSYWNGNSKEPNNFDLSVVRSEAAALKDYLNLLHLWFDEVLKNANQLQRKDLIEKFDIIYRKLEERWWIKLAPVENPSQKTNQDIAAFISVSINYIRDHFSPHYYYCPECHQVIPLYFDAPETIDCPNCGESIQGIQ